MVPCAQGRVIVETARPAPPYFATCSTYRRALVSRASTEMPDNVGPTTGQSGNGTTMDDQPEARSDKSATMGSSSPMIARPDDLGVTPWYLEDQQQYPTTDSSPGPVTTIDRSSYPFPSYGAERGSRAELESSTRNSSVEGEIPRIGTSGRCRKAYMDLRDAIALLDETCPNPEANQAPPTPRTPRTPQTPYPRNKRARSKSSDNSSNYSNDRLSDRSFETYRSQDKDRKKPFLRKIGTSKTEDRPFLAKLASKIIGKPYLEKIGPSKALDRPYLNKIESYRTMDKFVFDAHHDDECKTIGASKTSGVDSGEARMAEPSRKYQVHEELRERSKEERTTEELTTAERRRFGKGFLLKMYSFEMEDLDEVNAQKEHRKALRGTSLDNVLDSGPSSLPPMNNDEVTNVGGDSSGMEELSARRRSGNVAELLTCRVTTSEEIVCSSTGLGSSEEAKSWSNSPRRRRKSKRSDKDETSRSDDSFPSSPSKRPLSGDQDDSSRFAIGLDKDYVSSPAKSRKKEVVDEELLIVEDEKKLVEKVEDKEDENEEAEDEEKQELIERQQESLNNGVSGESIVLVEASCSTTAMTTPTMTIASYRRNDQDYVGKEAFRQLQDKFEQRDVSRQSFKWQGKIVVPCRGVGDAPTTDTKKTVDETTEIESRSMNDVASMEKREEDNASSDDRRHRSSRRYILKKQEGIDHPSDQESDTNASTRRQQAKRRIFQEPSQETMDLLTELRKVKSLLRTPSLEKDPVDLERRHQQQQQPVRLPKRILLTDKEFCLSVERENSVRRGSKAIDGTEKLETTKMISSTMREKEETMPDERNSEEKMAEEEQPVKVSLGPALFEKRCLSLDYADDEKPQREARTISLASTRDLPSEMERTLDYSDVVLICDAKSYESDVFLSPLDEIPEKTRETSRPRTETRGNEEEEESVDLRDSTELEDGVSTKKQRQEDIDRTTQQRGSSNDLHEIVSPRATPFRAKKRLGKISVEESVKPENFTLGSKVDCQTVVVQKRTKCFPL